MKLLVRVILCFALFISAVSSLTCYSCNYNVDRDCKGEDVKISNIGTQTDDDDACPYCYKQSWDNGKKGIRACMDQRAFNALDIKVDKCKEDAGVTTCICEADRCNGSVTLGASLLTLLGAALFRYTL